MNINLEQSTETAALLALDSRQAPAWNSLHQMLTGFRAAAIVIGATDLGFFDGPPPEGETASSARGRKQRGCRAARVLMNSLAALGFAAKDGETYTVPSEVRALFPADPG